MVAGLFKEAMQPVGPRIRVGVAALLAVAGAAVYLRSGGWYWPDGPIADTAIRLAAALSPALILAVAFYLEDRAEPEPWGNLIRYLLLGALSLGVAEAFRHQALGIIPADWRDAVDGAGLFARLLLTAGVGEELAKYACFRLGAWRDREIDEPYDGCIYAAYLSLSFAAVENTGFVLRAAALDESLGVAALRAATAVPAHALFGAAWGLAFGLARFDRGYRLLPWLVLPATMLMHGLFDWLAISAAQLQRDLLGVLALVAMLAVASVVCILGIHEAHRRSQHR